MFSMEVSREEGTMSYTSSLQNIDSLAAALGISGGIASLDYHLHTMWTNEESPQIDGTECGASRTGGHYDPLFGCGPASAVPSATCDELGTPQSDYDCPDTLCEVGDLSGKYGSIDIGGDGSANEVILDDPDSVVENSYMLDYDSNDAAIFSAIVFHHPDSGGARVLCARLVKTDP
jgi:hypothetical protein